MPSSARRNARDRMLPEIGRIIEAHHKLRKGKRGRDEHKSILRSSVMMLCATWELYCENLAMEATIKLARGISNVHALPKAVQLQIVQYVHHEQAVKSGALRLSGDGWRAIYARVVKHSISSFNSPKSGNLDKLFIQAIGLRKISESWSHSAHEIDGFVRMRGEIAHRGSEAKAIGREEAAHFKAMISKTISETDNAVYDHLKNTALLGKAPWQKTAK